MTNQDWTEQLRQRMDNYEAPVPDDLWAGVERRVGRHARIAMLRRWVAAAAVVALLVGGGWMLRGTGEQPLTAEAGGEQSVVGEQMHPAPSTESAVQRDAGMVCQSAPPANHVVMAHNERSATPPPEIALTPEIQDTPDVSETSEPAVAQDAQQVRESTGVTKSQDSPPDTPVLPRQNNPRRSSPGSRYTVSLAASNLLATNTLTTVEPVRMSPAYMGSLSAAMARTAPVFLANSQEEAAHHAPISFGLTVSRALTPRWWAECGLSYSYVASTFTHRYPTHVTSDDQRLHYVGVPFAVGYTFWQTDRLRTYATAGAEAMVNVSARVSQGNIRRDRVQIAVGLSVGISYELLPATSIYCQPSLRCYPDNGSALQNIFKDRPLQFDLRLGLRYSIGSRPAR